MPIVKEVFSILNGESNPKEAVKKLMRRKLKWEWEGIKNLISRELHFSEPIGENLNN